MSHVIVAWKGRKLEIGISPNDTLGTLMAKCSRETGVPVDRIKLLSSGESPASKRKRNPGPGVDSDPLSSFFGSVQKSFTGIGSWFGATQDDQGESEKKKTAAEERRKREKEGAATASVFTRPDLEQPSHQQQQPPPNSRDLGTRCNVLGMEDFKGSYVMMKDQNASLHHYGIKSGSKIMMMGDIAPIPQEQPSTPPFPLSSSASSVSASTAPKSALEKLAELDAKLTSTVLPLVEPYISSALEYTTEPQSSSFTPATETIDQAHASKKLKDEHAKVSELVLQVMLKVDSVSVEGDEEGRAARKALVKKCNGVLDRLDSMRERVREFEALRGGAAGEENAKM